VFMQSNREATLYEPTRPATPTRIYRIARGFSQGDLAARAGVSRRTVIRLENGGNVHLDTIAAIAEALGLRVEALFPGSSP
jgi:transcriptional regulator with XRE-family HTH domain